MALKTRVRCNHSSMRSAYKTSHIRRIIYGDCVMTDFSLASIAVVEKVREAGDHSLGSILLFSGVGLLATLALMTLGIDIGAGWV
jgi:hypothetical protein